jgi:hypothetical protein
MRITSFIGLTLALTLCQAANAQKLRINEIYASHTGTDDMEFIELKGTPLLKLDGYMVLVVEGDSTGAGTLDRAWDLKGLSVPADGYFVLGDTAVSAKDFDIGASNRIENGTDTFYLVKTGDASKITALLGKKIVDPNNPAKTTIPSLATIWDIIGMVDGGITGTDKTFDGAKNLGPDGNYLPAGVYRTSDLMWCETGWLDFDDVANTNAPSTAGAKNTAHCGKATIASKGKSCLTGVGTTGGPALKSSIPSIGKSFDTKIALGKAGAVGFLFGGVEGGPTPFLRCSIHLNVAALLNLGAFTFTATTSELKLPLPYSVSLIGSKFAVQAAIATATTLHLTNAALGQIGY